MTGAVLVAAMGVILLVAAGAVLTALRRNRRSARGTAARENAAVLRREERWKKRHAKLETRREKLEAAIANAEYRLAERMSDLASSAPDRSLRTFLEIEHPALADPTATDLRKVEWLRHWVYEHVPHCKYGDDLDPLAFDIINKPVTTVLKELVERHTGFQCAGMAWILYRLCQLFGYPACTLNVGGLPNSTSHMLAIVEIATPGGPLWTVQDPHFDFTLEDDRGRPLDVRRALAHLGRGRIERIHVPETRTPRSILVLPSNLGAIQKLEASGAREIDKQGVHRRFVHPLSPAVFRSWHPEVFEEIRRQFGHDHLMLLLLLPLNVHGDRRFKALLPLAAKTLREVREAREPLHLIFSIGKTGTRAIEQTLLRARVQGLVHRTHFLSREVIRERASVSGLDEASASDRAQAADARKIRRLLVRQLAIRRRTPGLPAVRVISGVREPVAQILSRLFQNPLHYLGALDGLTPQQVSQSLERLVLGGAGGDSIASAALRDRSARAMYFVDWFDREMRAVLGLDVYATPFPWERGWQVFDLPAVRVLVYRQEDLGCLSGVLAEFVGVERLDFVHTNRRAETPLTDLYVRCLEECRFSEPVLDVLYGSRYARHFYSPREIEVFRARTSLVPSPA